MKPNGESEDNRGELQKNGIFRQFVQIFAGTVNIEVKKEAKKCEKKSERGDTIKWFYKGTLSNGKEFDRGKNTKSIHAAMSVSRIVF